MDNKRYVTFDGTLLGSLSAYAFEEYADDAQLYNGIADLERQLAESREQVQFEKEAAHGWRVNAVAATDAKAKLAAERANARKALALAPTPDDYALMAISLSGQALQQNMADHIAAYRVAYNAAMKGGV